MRLARVDKAGAGDRASDYVYIDQMRGIAILMVIAVHYSQNFAQTAIRLAGTIGQYGVQLFFVASAITLCLSAERHRDEPHPVRNFYIRRLFRIAPLYYLGVFAYWAIYTADGRAEAYTAGNIAANLAFVHGFVTSANNTIVPGGWSIGVEMVFYLAFPFAYHQAQLVRARWGAAGVSAGLGLVLAGTVAFQFVYFAITGNRIANNTFAYYFIANQVAVFALAIGWYLCFVREDRRLCEPRVAMIGFCSGLATCAAILIANFAPLVGLTPAIAAAAFVCLAERLRTQALRAPWLAEIGKVSFSLYVLHFALVWWPVKWLVATFHANPGAEFAAFVPLYAATVAILVLAARITRRLVEEPGNALGRKLIRRLNASRAPGTAL